MESSWPTLVAALIAATVATFGYLLNARAKRLEDRRRTYAAALSAVSAYNELPHRIRRRPDSEPATRGRLGDVISNTQHDLFTYRWLLTLESPAVGRQYDALVKMVWSFGKQHRAKAWATAPAESDDDCTYDEIYRVDADEEVEYCLEAMRQNLRLLAIPEPPFTRRRPPG